MQCKYRVRVLFNLNHKTFQELEGLLEAQSYSLTFILLLHNQKLVTQQLTHQWTSKFSTRDGTLHLFHCQETPLHSNIGVARLMISSWHWS